MSQSPLAALNAFGLFAAGLLGEQGRTRSNGGGRHYSDAVRHFSPTAMYEVAEYDLPVEEAKALLELLAHYEVTSALP